MKNKTVLITGGSRGIGRACALAFAKEGYSVAVNYCSHEAAAAELCREIRAMGGIAAAYRFDVSRGEAVKEAFAEILRDFGSVDVLINNAGIAQQKLFDTLTEEDYDRLMGVNLKGVFNCSVEAVRHMLKSHRGSIINISSMWAREGASMEVLYCASKAAVEGMTRALAKEAGPSGIRVNCIAPGLIDTSMNAMHDPEVIEELIEETALMRIGTGEDIARTAVFLAGESAGYITGQTITVDGGR